MYGDYVHDIREGRRADQDDSIASMFSAVVPDIERLHMLGSVTWTMRQFDAPIMTVFVFMSVCVVVKFGSPSQSKFFVMICNVHVSNAVNKMKACFPNAEIGLCSILPRKDKRPDQVKCSLCLVLLEFSFRRPGLLVFLP
jgi:hypothetical protein